MDMVKKFNNVMEGFIPGDITFDWLKDNPEGELRNGSSVCHYKLKKVDGDYLLGAFGVSRFTNWQFYEITETGKIQFEWYLQEMCIANDPESIREMDNNNNEGFGIRHDISL